MTSRAGQTRPVILERAALAEPSLEVFEFVDLPGGRSRIDGLSAFLSVPDRDMMIGDLDDGRDEDYERLDEVLAGTPQAAPAG